MSILVMSIGSGSCMGSWEAIGNGASTGCSTTSDGSEDQGQIYLPLPY